jgi:hypothetical protein
LNPSTFIQVADFVIKITSGDGTILKLGEGFDSFICDESEDLAATVVFYGQIPTQFLSPTKSLYKAKLDDQLFWEIVEHENGVMFKVYHPEKLNEIQQIALYEEQKKEWTIYCLSEIGDAGAEANPLAYPLSPLLWHNLVVNNEAIMIHASGVFDGEEGRIFSGFSGVGKSTMAKLWNSKGSLVINDDRLIIRKKKDGYWMYNTPMYYPDAYKKSRLHHVYLPYHHSEFSVTKLEGIQGVARMMAFIIQHGYNQKNQDAYFQFVSDLMTTLPICQLGVVPIQEVVDFIQSYEKENEK